MEVSVLASASDVLRHKHVPGPARRIQKKSNLSVRD